MNGVPIPIIDIQPGQTFYCAGDRAWQARWWKATAAPRPLGGLVVVHVIDARGFTDTVTATPDFALATEGPIGHEEPPTALTERTIR